MKIENKEMKEVVTTITQCDYCEETAIHRCEICKKDTCRQHTHLDYSGGGYAVTFCKQCWDIGKEFRKEIDKVERNLELKISILKSQWHTKCEETK